MSGPRFRPVEIVVNPRHYGRVWEPEWASDHGLSPSQEAWALAQHRAAFEVHEGMKWHPLTRPNPPTLESLAGELGESPSWLRRKLTGQVPADVGDLLGWARLIGPQVWPLVEGPEDLSLGSQLRRSLSAR